MLDGVAVSEASVVDPMNCPYDQQQCEYPKCLSDFGYVDVLCKAANPPKEPTVVGPFRGKWAKLGNYSPCLVFFQGHAYQTLEHAYQAQKTLDPAIQKLIRHAPSPAVAKKLAREVALRPDWDQVKQTVMWELLVDKFSQEPERSILASTGIDQIVEVNWWHDNYWGDCKCDKRVECVSPGQNVLGKMLMQLRSRL